MCAAKPAIVCSPAINLLKSIEVFKLADNGTGATGLLLEDGSLDGSLDGSGREIAAVVGSRREVAAVVGLGREVAAGGGLSG